jgi:hypothetical protein
MGDLAKALLERSLGSGASFADKSYGKVVTRAEARLIEAGSTAGKRLKGLPLMRYRSRMLCDTPV